jgi:N-acetylmuramic acid 6-phosphate etherase
MTTETQDARFIDIDKWSALDAVNAMAEGQFSAVSAVQNAKEQIAYAVEKAQERLFGTKGRLVYVGAGTSGRVAVQDGVELVPTFGWSWDRLIFAMAGGEEALMRAVENAEDDFEQGRKTMADYNIGKDDVIIAVAASGRTPFTLGAVEGAKERGALTIGFANNNGTPLILEPHCSIFLDTGSEPVAGSTRMKAGTSQKVALNIFSTALMIALGGVYKGLMVGMIATNQKLRNRAVRIIKALTKCDDNTAQSAINEAHGNLKIAVMIAIGYGDCAQSISGLEETNGNLRKALEAFED